jgi:hypothetical protein
MTCLGIACFSLIAGQGELEFSGSRKLADPQSVRQSVPLDPAPYFVGRRDLGLLMGYQ